MVKSERNPCKCKIFTYIRNVKFAKTVIINIYTEFLKCMFPKEI